MRRRLAAGLVLVALATLIPASPVAAGAEPCLVRNVTQATQGRSFKEMVAAAEDHDRLQVRGRCLAVRVDIDVDVAVRGVGDAATLHGDRRGRVLRVVPGASVTLRNLTITGGGTPPQSTSPSQGGAIRNDGTLVVTDSIVRDNGAGGAAGGITNHGVMTLVRSVVRGNAAFGSPGGILNERSGAMTVVDSVVSRNHTTGYEGGIGNRGDLTLVRSVVQLNTADEVGGIGNDGTLTLVDSQVRRNTADYWYGGIDNAGTLVLVGSSVRHNVASEFGGGGIWNREPGTVLLDEASSVTGNTPDDCRGTTAC